MNDWGNWQWGEDRVDRFRVLECKILVFYLFLHLDGWSLFVERAMISFQGVVMIFCHDTFLRVWMKSRARFTDLVTPHKPIAFILPMWDKFHIIFIAIPEFQVCWFEFSAWKRGSFIEAWKGKGCLFLHPFFCCRVFWKLVPQQQKHHYEHLWP